MSILRTTAFLAGSLLPGLAIANAALGDEFRVNTTTVGNQGSPVVASAADGRFVVVWEGDSPGSDLNDIYAQLYSAAGAKLGSEFRVNTTTAERQNNAAVAMNASGEFIVAWNSATHLAAHNGTFAQRFAADGRPLGGEFRVNSGERDIYSLVSVAINASGDFVIAWPERGGSLPVATNMVNGLVLAQRYDASGAPKGEPITVQNTPINSLRVPSVGIDDSGGFVVAWNSDAQAGYITQTSSLGLFLGVFARRYGADGKALGGAFQVDTSRSDISVDRPVISVAPNGSFAVAWQTTGSDYSSRGIMLRRYDANGAALGAPLAAEGAKLARKPAVSLNSAGQLVVAGHSDGLYVQVYGANTNNGAAVAAAQRADGATTSNAILQPAVAIDANGGFVAAWQVLGLDGSGRGVYARRFAP
jgi:hypothetical protein